MNQKSPKVVLLAGPNGAGKSTIAPALISNTLGLMEFVNADTIAHGLSAFEPEKVAITAGRIMLTRIRQLASAHESFAFETTLASRLFARWIETLSTEGYQFHLFFIWLPNPQFAIKRVSLRVAQGGHHVTSEVILRRYEAGLRNLFQLYMPLAFNWQIHDGSKTDVPIIAKGGIGRSLTVFQAKQWGIIKKHA